MSKRKRSNSYRPPVLERDRARPRTAPAISNPVVEGHLNELVSPSTYALAEHYHRLGLRERILTLPIMVAMVLAMIWRQVPSVAELIRTSAREGLLWTPPVHVSQQAFEKRLRFLPAELFGEVFQRILPTLLERSRLRSRPQPPAVAHALGHFQQIWVLDATTLEEVSKKVGLLQGVPQTVLGGKLLAILDLPSKLPVQLWLNPDSSANEKSFLDQIKTTLTQGSLLILDRGFYSFPFFDYLTEHGLAFVTRARTLAAFDVQEVLVSSAQVRDRIITMGRYRSNPCRHPLRLVEVLVEGTWRAYLTNVLDPTILPTAEVVDLYARRWKIEDAFLLVKRLLGLSYLWNGAFNTIQLQVWASWLLYAVLIDLSDAVAEELSLPLDRISVEMVYRGLYHFTVAYSKGQTSNDPVAYLASQSDLGVVKRRRKYRERAELDKQPGELKL